MSNCTPGPWTATGHLVRKQIVGGDALVIARCIGPDHFSNVSNAKLMAAAPDLSEALYLALMGAPGWQKVAREAMKKIGGQR